MRRTSLFWVIVFLFLQQSAWSAEDDDLIFAPKNFADFGDSVVGISGTLTGDGIGYKNNTYAIACYKERRACFISSIEQIGARQIGRMDYPYSYPIVKWDAYEVIAAEEPSMFGCNKATITTVRKRETALWVREPINQTRPECKDSDTRFYKWTIEDSLGWKRMHGK
jgi:hypothetical protein